MSKFPADLRYTAEHEWLRVDGAEAVVGITDHAQETLGDITFVELPAVGASFGGGEVFGVVESVKAASDLFLPVAGTVVAINDALDADPGRINTDPYREGWLVRIQLDDPSATGELLDAEAYQRLVDAS